MWKYNNTDTLYHHGVLGQKWGVRRMRSAVTNAKARRAIKKSMKAQAKEDARKAASDKKPATDDSKRNAYRTMSDDELKQAVTRLSQERLYKQYYNELNPKQVSAGERFVKNAKKIASDVAMEKSKKIVSQLADKAVDKMMNSSAASTAKATAKESKEAGKEFAKNMKDVVNEAKQQTSSGYSQSKNDKSYHDSIFGNQSYSQASKTPQYKETAQIGQTYIAGLLEDKHTR